MTDDADGPSLRAHPASPDARSGQPTMVVAAAFVGASSIMGCGTPTASDFFTTSDAGPPSTDESYADAAPTFLEDASPAPSRASGSTVLPAVIYAHSPTQLYRLNPTTDAVSLVGTFSGACALDEIIDIALDKSSNAYVTGFAGFYKLDLATAVCTLVARGGYPNSLSFVPKGTLDPNEEALVGYEGSTYVRIDTASGVITDVGTLAGGYQSSGDIVSTIDGGTFLTANGNGCGDCLLQVNPRTGDLVQNYGSVLHPAVYGLAFWAGTVYGFDNAGEIFSVGPASNGTLAIHDIPVTHPPAGLQFYGAGSTTTAPPTAPDGGGIPLM
jgi:hypothetical protein